MQLVVIAKEPRPGRVKTRLTPPCTPAQAAVIAEAALTDTLAVVAATPADRRVLLLDGEAGPWLPPGFEVVTQRGEGLGDRLSAGMVDCFAAAPGPVVLVGMDTPQLTSARLLQAAGHLSADAPTDAVLGPADDGGYWLIGLRALGPAGDPFDGVPMSEPTTFVAQRRQLARCGYRVQVVGALTDVDTVADARRIAAAIPGSRFAAAVGAAVGAAAA